MEYDSYWQYPGEDTGSKGYPFLGWSVYGKVGAGVGNATGAGAGRAASGKVYSLAIANERKGGTDADKACSEIAGGFDLPVLRSTRLEGDGASCISVYQCRFRLCNPL